MIDIIKPTLVINKTKILENISKISNFSKTNSITFRPHFKTHQSLEVGNYFKKYGVRSITVSSVSMAEYFSSDWDDITIAFPINILEINQINNLSKKININLLIDSLDTLLILEKELRERVNFYIKINVGYNRAGIDYSSDKLDKIIESSKNFKKLNLVGFLSHFGNTYNTRSLNQIKKVFKDSINKLEILNSKYPNYDISIGDTPSCSVIEKYPPFISEIRPGNFIFYDLFQFKLGSCKLENIAIRMLSPVVSIYNDRKLFLVYCGAIHLSKDYIIEDGVKIYGYVFLNNYWDTENKIGKIISLSQEHGLVTIENNTNLKIGDIVSIIPVHSCLTVDSMGEYYCDKKIQIMN